MPTINASDLPAYAFLDPASARKARTQGIRHTRSRSAIIVARYDRAYGRIFVVHAWADRVPANQIIEKAISVELQYTPKLFGVESSGQQYLFADSLSENARLRGHRVKWYPIDQPTTTHKDDRIRDALQPLIAAGRLFVPPADHAPWCQLLLDEIQGFPTAITKDLVDALASVIIHLIPPLVVRPPSQSTELRELGNYLRARGFSPAYIEHRLAEVKQQLTTA